MTKPAYHILIGNSEGKLNEMLVKNLHLVLQDHFVLNITTLDHLGKLTKAAGQQKFDLCILVLNGITVPQSKHDTSVFPHIDWILDFVAALKAKYRIPVIALSSYCLLQPKGKH